MAEIVGLVTGIGTIVTTALAIAKTVSAVANDLGTAGSQIKAIGADTKAFALVLHGFKGRVDKNFHKFDSDATSVLKETVAICKSEIEDMQRHLMPLFQSDEGRKMELKQRAKWLFAKSKVSTTKASLDSMKATLSLLLHTMEYMEGDIVEDFIEENIHEMIAESKGTKEKFLKAQRIDLTVEVMYDHITSHQTTDAGIDDRHRQPVASAISHERSQTNDADETKNHTMDMTIHQWASSETVLASERLEPFEPDGNLPAEFGQANLSTERALVETLSDENFLQIADHLRLHRKVTGFALAIIAQPQKSQVHVSKSEKTAQVEDGAQSTDQGVSNPFYREPDLRSIGDDESQETISTNSVGAEWGSEVDRQRFQAQHTSTPGKHTANRAQYYGKRPRSGRSDEKQWSQEHHSHGNEVSGPGSEAPHRGNPSYPNTTFDEHMRGAAAGHQSYIWPNRDYVPQFSPPWASGQQPNFYGSAFRDPSNPFMPGYFQQEAYHFPSSPPPLPKEVESNPKMEQMKRQLEILQGVRKEQEENKPNPQMEQMKRQLEILQGVRKEQEETQKLANFEQRIREDTERAFKHRMEEMQKAQEEAKKEIELAKIEAERAARKRLEKEQQQVEERRRAEEKQREYALAKVELEIRQKLEREETERKQRQRSRGLFKWSSWSPRRRCLTLLK